MSEIITGILQSIGEVLAVTWWILIPLVLAYMAWGFWLFHIRVNYLRSQKWVLLEIKIPEGIERTPKAMEQVFNGIYGIYSFGLRWKDKYIEGKLKEDHVSFELVGHAGGINFYARTPAPYRNLVESAIYAQYPDAEVSEAADYTKLFPKVLPNKNFDIFGIDYHLIRDSVYSIRNYEYFEEPKEEKRLDPISAIAEVMSRLQNDEAIWLQIMVSPAGEEWKGPAAELRDKMFMRPKQTKKKTLLGGLVEFIKNLITAPADLPIWGKKPETRPLSLINLSEGEKKVLEAVEDKVSRHGFYTGLRFIYIDRKTSFTRSNVAAVMSTFHQFTDADLNGFRPNINTMTIVRGFMKRRRVFYRKRMMYQAYLRMRWPRKVSVLNTTELATIYHFPAGIVGAPLLRRIGSKKGEPPAGLPIG